MIEQPVTIISTFINIDDNYLLVHDPKFKFWRVPGGRIEKRESPQETLVREGFEELDIKLKVGRLLGYGHDHVYIYNVPDVTDVHRLILYFESKIVSGTIKIKEENEADKYKIVSLDEIKKTNPLEPAMRYLFKEFKL